MAQKTQKDRLRFIRAGGVHLYGSAILPVRTDVNTHDKLVPSGCYDVYWLVCWEMANYNYSKRLLFILLSYMIILCCHLT